MQPAVRFSLDDVVELPDLIERTIDIELGKKQKEVYDQLRQHAYAAVQSGEVTAANAGAVLMKLLQVSLGYVYGKDPATGDRTVVTLDNAARLEALVDDVTACDQKVIIFAPFRHAIEGIVTRLGKEGFDVATIHGGVPKGDRDKIFPAFQQTTKYKVLVADTATMAHGITLTAASTIIWFGPTNSLETFEQANARIRRIGQKNKQQVLMYQATAAERRMYRRLRAKQAVQTNLLEMFADATQ
jgi:SNF2 family DNA or RNA helicase